MGDEYVFPFNHETVHEEFLASIWYEFPVCVTSFISQVQSLNVDPTNCIHNLIDDNNLTQRLSDCKYYSADELSLYNDSKADLTLSQINCRSLPLNYLSIQAFILKHK